MRESHLEDTPAETIHPLLHQREDVCRLPADYVIFTLRAPLILSNNTFNEDVASQQTARPNGQQEQKGTGLPQENTVETSVNKEDSFLPPLHLCCQLLNHVCDLCFLFFNVMAHNHGLCKANLVCQYKRKTCNTFATMSSYKTTHTQQ